MGYTTLHRFQGKEGFERVITPENSNLRHMNFSRILLSCGQELEYEVVGEEMAVVLQGGDFTGAVEYSKGKGLDEIYGNRKSVYDELPTAVYLPPGSKIKIKTEGGMEARIFSTPCVEGNDPCFVQPKDIKEGIPGALNWKRKYRFIFSPQSNVTKKLIVGESVSVPGGWIGFPAHKHENTCENEYPLDEIFSFKIKAPHGGYAIQHTYSLEEKWDEYHTVDGDDIAIAIPKGYHTSWTVPGCTYYLLWGLAGECKTYKLVYDARFAWLADVENLFTF
ncbi:5-deoxy-glucuronate isomerase [Desulfitibacter alkalitolerans]|uniref:5-deoxy-glucuronate isomerase n=1 Tax=Desulfitibacter alkalitolerans TaxID=264641 RepID=UPI0004897BDF|nr:5-deoxy-glucuronate isomerase [Desulfitibacter alkalitolerans]